MKCTCRKCGLVFGGIVSFDMHRVGSHSKNERRCLSDEEMLRVGLRIGSKGVWMRNPPIVFNRPKKLTPQSNNTCCTDVQTA